MHTWAGYSKKHVCVGYCYYDFGQCYSYHFHLERNHGYDYYKLLQVPMITCQCYCHYNYPCRYMVQQNRILSDYPTLWPAQRYAVKKGKLYDLTPDES